MTYIQKVAYNLDIIYLNNHYTVTYCHEKVVDIGVFSPIGNEQELIIRTSTRDVSLTENDLKSEEFIKDFRVISHNEIYYRDLLI